MRHTGLAILLSLLPVLAAGKGPAPEAGAPLPSLTATDVTGQAQRLRDLIEGPTLVVAITDRHAGDRMRAWFQEAEVRVPGVNQVSIISVGIPFFVSDSYARSRAREHVPRRWWHASLFDSDRSVAGKLGLPEDELPYAFAVDGGGRVLAVAHGRPDDRAAQRVWGALKELEAGRPLASDRRDRD
jgi:hypothetical protein